MQRILRGAARRRSVLGLLAAAALGAAACGSSGAAPPEQGGVDGGNAAVGAPAASPAPAAPGDASAPGPVQAGQDAAVRDGAKIIRTGSLQLDVGDVEKALGAARTAIQGLGGFIGASQQYRDGDNTVATITYRIPAERWEDALDALRRLGSEVSEKTDSADVTGQLVDLDARIRNLKASETALVGYIERATKVDDILEIESRLSDVRGQIEQLTAQQASLADQVAYATLAVTFGVTDKAIQTAADSWDPLSEIDKAGASLVGFVQGLATAGIWFVIVWLPILAVVGFVIAAVVVVGRRFGLFRRSAPPMPPMPPAPPTPAEG